MDNSLMLAIRNDIISKKEFLRSRLFDEKILTTSGDVDEKQLKRHANDDAIEFGEMLNFYNVTINEFIGKAETFNSLNKATALLYTVYSYCMKFECFLPRLIDATFVDLKVFTLYCNVFLETLTAKNVAD